MSRYATYMGDEFEDFLGEVCEVENDNRHPDFPCYKIRFLIQPNEWVDNIDDADIQFFTPTADQLKQYKNH